MKVVPTQEAAGMVLCHDVTRIVPGEFKGRAFKKGHVIQDSDISELLNMGKEHIYVFDLKEGWVHEDEAALRIAKSAAGPGIRIGEAAEGRVNLTAERDGLLTINADALYQINALEDIVFASLHTHQPVKKEKAVAGTRIVPLVTQEKNVRDAEEICRNHSPVIEIKPFQSLSVGIVTTGSEIYHGRIEDRFGPVLREKFAELGSRVLRQVFVSDDTAMTVRAIADLLADGAEMIAVTGGMSVDPDDQTPASIRAAGGKVVTYGAPVFPGAMFMLAYIDGIPVVGLPGCVMYYRASIFDLVVPRILAGESLTRDDFVRMGHGGFCAGCEQCRYPLCGFGKGN
ncbi:MAG: molybdopterin-binding protein [Desulfobacterales bacterium]